MEPHIELEERDASDAPRSRAPDRARGASAVVALAALFGTGLVDAIAPAPRQRPIGTEAVEARRLQRDHRVLDGTWARWIERDRDLRSRVRSWTAPYWSAILMRFALSVPEEVVLGRGGWLFLRRRIEPPGGETRRSTLERTAVALHAVRRRHALYGTRLVVAPLPRKAVVCRERLPASLDPDPAYDADLVTALRRRGVETLDLLPAWEALADEDAYLPLDSHWGAGAQDAFVAAAAEAIGADAPRGDVDLVCNVTIEPGRAALLDFTGVGRRHPARHIIGVGRMRGARLDDASRAIVDAGAAEADVALAGSSFTDAFDVGDLLAARLDVPIDVDGVRGVPFPAPLAMRLRSEERSRMPSVLVYEFPTHDAFAPPGSSASFLGVFARTLEAPRVVPLRSEDVGGTARRRDGSYVFPPGTLLSSGDGVLHLSLRCESEERTRWLVTRGSSRVAVTLDDAKRAVVIPVLDPTGARRPLRITPAGLRARAALLDIRVMTDADVALSRGVSGPVSVAPLDVLAVRLVASAPFLRVTATGRDQRGAEIARTFDLGAARSRLALFSLAPFEGGTLDAVRVEGPTQPAQIEIVPAARE
ncbi:MAG: hypothetical protein AAGI22_08905 [Planctomycetota bacterium]